MSAPRRIFLVGFMGAGKTTVGRRLSDRLGYPFVDIDEIVEAATGASVREIFEREGEPEFRRREASVLETAIGLDRAVVATGGGTFVAETNRRLISESGVSVFLEVPFPVLTARISEKSETRPLFSEPVQAFRLYCERLDFYRMADIVLGVRADETVEEISERVLLALPYRGGERTE